MGKNEKRGWAVVAIFLLTGLLCVFAAGNLAIRFAPNWSLNADMRSRLDVDSAYLTSIPLERDIVFQPVDPSILTPPGWINVFLTPGAIYPTRVPRATSTATQPAAVPTQQPTQATSSPTPTLVWVYFTPTQTPPAGPASTPTTPPTLKPVVTPSNPPPPQTDLQITIDDGVTSYTPGGTLYYTVVAANNSTFTVNGAVVTDIFPAVISGASWSCAPDAGASCTPNGTGNISDSVILPPGLKVTYSITAPVSSYTVGTLTNSVSIAAPAGFVETMPGDNQAQDSNACAKTEPDVGPPNGGWLPIPPGSSIILELSQPIIADGDAGVPDLVYYERPVSLTSSSIEMDSVQVEISADGNTWHQILYWDDGIPDVNTNIDISKKPISDICPTEVDNCIIPFDSLYKNTGITIDIDGYAPPGSYPWMRLTSPPSVDEAEVDAIQPYYP